MNAALPKLREDLLRSAGGRALLTLLSWLYGAAVLARQRLYGWGILSSRRLPARTICIGNLTAGGTGKTTAVLLAARTLRQHEKSVAILTRGYARPSASKEVKVLHGGRSVGWMEAGDEPWMMHQTLKDLDVPILVCPDRYRAGMDAVSHYDPDVLLLDDGYQHLALRRDLDVLLLSAADPFGGGRLLPRGTLREPLGAMRRAGMIIITHSDSVPLKRLDEIRLRIRETNPKAQILQAVHRPDHLFDLKREGRRPLKQLKGLDVSCFCGLGDPAPFEAHLRGLGAKVRQAWRFPDHHPYTRRELRSIDGVREKMAVVTTFKDAARLPADWDQVLQGEVLALGIRMEITEGLESWEALLLQRRGRRS